jgi:WD40 repeat protein
MWRRDANDETWSLAASVVAHIGPLTALSCQLTVPWVMSAGRDGKLRLWGRQDRNIVAQVSLTVENWLYMIGSHQQLPLAATVERNGPVRVWRISPTACGLPPAAHDHPISAICVSSEGALLACGCKGGYVKVRCACSCHAYLECCQCRPVERRYGGLLGSLLSLTPIGWHPMSMVSWVSDSSRMTRSCSL